MTWPLCNVSVAVIYRYMYKHDYKTVLTLDVLCVLAEEQVLINHVTQMYLLLLFLKHAEILTCQGTWQVNV